MLSWITYGGLILVLAILADDWYAKRHRKPLSHMKPDPKSIHGVTGLQDVDVTRTNKQIAQATTPAKARKKD